MYTIFSPSVEVEALKYFLEFQGYPITSQNGTASIYNVSGWDIKEAMNIFKLYNIYNILLETLGRSPKFIVSF